MYDNHKSPLATPLFALALGAIASAAAAQGTVTQTDGTFTPGAWAEIHYADGPGGSIQTSQQPSGGNSGAYRSTSVLHNAASTTSKSQLLIAHRRVGSGYDPRVSGEIASIDFSIDTIKLFAEWPGWGGYAIGPAVFQGNNVYTFLAFTTPEATWTSKRVSGLTAIDFSLLTPVTGVPNTNLHPDFSCTAAPLEFGYYQRSTHTGPTQVSRGAGVDNWRIDLRVSSGRGSFVPFGAGCGPRPPQLGTVPGQLPVAGQPFSISVGNLAIGQPPGTVFLAIGATRQPVPVDLGAIGAPGCQLLIAPAALAPCQVLPIGIASVTLNLPNTPGAMFYVQAVVLDRAANPLGVTLSDAAEVKVGC